MHPDLIPVDAVSSARRFDAQRSVAGCLNRRDRRGGDAPDFIAAVAQRRGERIGGALSRIDGDHARDDAAPVIAGVTGVSGCAMSARAAEQRYITAEPASTAAATVRACGAARRRSSARIAPMRWFNRDGVPNATAGVGGTVMPALTRSSR